MWEVKHVAEGDIYRIKVGEGKIHKTLERSPDILVDVNEHGEALGIEVVGASATPVGDLMLVLDEFGLVAPAATAV